SSGASPAPPAMCLPPPLPLTAGPSSSSIPPASAPWGRHSCLPRHTLPLTPSNPKALPALMLKLPPPTSCFSSPTQPLLGTIHCICKSLQPPTALHSSSTTNVTSLL